jgi:hypothetical protein
MVRDELSALSALLPAITNSCFKSGESMYFHAIAAALAAPALPRGARPSSWVHPRQFILRLERRLF